MRDWQSLWNKVKLTVGNECNRVKGQGIRYPNEVLKKLFITWIISYRVESMQQEIGWIDIFAVAVCCTKKWGFPLRISSVNVTKSAVFCVVVKKTIWNFEKYLSSTNLSTKS